MATRRIKRSEIDAGEDGPPVIEGVEFLSPAEWQAMLEEIAQRDLGMSVAEFERAYWAGELDPCEGRVASLAVLLAPRA